MQDHTTNTRKRFSILLVTALMALAMLLAAAPAEAHQNNQGTLKVHDDEVERQQIRNVPHVQCDFWVEGFNMFDDSGILVFYSWPPTGDMSEVMNDTWNGTDEGEGRGFHFLNGPYNLTAGHYRVEAFSDGGHPGNHTHFSKTKTFWVEPCEEDLPELECPPDGLSATALEGGDIRLTFNTTEGADGTNIYRAEGDGDFEYLATVGANVTTYLDEDTKIGVTYTYTIAALFGDRESFDCEQVEVTAIPVFPTFVAGILAATLAIGAYAFSRRRR